MNKISLQKNILRNKTLTLCAALAFLAGMAGAVSAQTSSQFTTSQQVFGSTDTTAPSVPTNVVATAVSTDQIDVSWAASTDNVSVAGYRLFRDGSFLATTTATSYIDSGLAASTTYVYWVEAFDTAVNISASSTSATSTTFAPPPASNPGSGSGSNPSSSGGSQIPLIYGLTIQPGLTTAEIDFSTVAPTLAKLYWGTTRDYEAGTISGTVYSSDHSLKIDDLTPGTTYYIRIDAVSGYGVSASEASSFVTLPASSVYLPENPANFSALYGNSAISLSWQSPATASSVVIVRSDKFFPTDVTEGMTVYQGAGASYVDRNVAQGTRYYYAAFAVDAQGNYSSGAIASAIVPASSGVLQPPSNPLQNLPPAPSVDPRIAALTLQDISFIQDGRSIPPAGTDITVDGSENLTLSIGSDALPEVLKTIAVTLADPSDPSSTFSFLLHINKAGTAYEATIAPLGKSGVYQFSLVIVDYKNQGLKQLGGTLTADVFSSGELVPNSSASLWWLATIPVLLVIVIVIWARRKRSIILSLAFLMALGGSILCMSHAAFAAYNPEMNYQGKLTNSSNMAVADGTYNMTFKLYTQASGGSAIWTESDTGSNAVAVSNGLFSVMLGSTTALTGVDFNQTLYLGVTIESDSEMTPRKIIGAVPAAFVAGTSTVALSANTLQGLQPIQFFRNDTQNSTSTSSTFLNVLQSGVGKVAEFFGAASQSVLAILSNGNVGIGSSTPSALLSIQGSSTAPTTALMSISSSTGASLLTVVSSGNVGIGTTSPFSTFSVVGNTYLSGNLTATGTLTLAALNGPLQANAGLVSATTSVGVLYGGTGLTSAPSYGQVLVGNASGGYTLTATSSLGLGGGSNGGSVVLSGGTSYTAQAANTTNYYPLVGSEVGTTSEGSASSRTVISKPGTVKNLYITINVAPGSSKTDTYTVMLNGVATALTCSITGTSATTCSDISDTFSANAADQLGMKVVTASGATISKINWSVELLVGSATGGANLALDNLSSVAINTSLLPGTTNSINLGSASKVWSTAYVNTVGIGTTSPIATLSVVGNTYLSGNLTATGTLNVSGNTTLANASTTNLTLSGNLFDSLNSAGSNGWVLQSTGSGVKWVSTTTLGISGGGGTPAGSTGQIQFNNGGSFAASSSLTWDNILGNLTANFFTATSTTATSTFAGGLNVGNGGLTYNYSSGVTSIASLRTGNLNFDTDAGVVSWTDLPIDSTPISGQPESYSAQIGGTSVLTVYGEANGSGGTQNLGVGIGTTSPKSTLTVVGSGCFSVGSGASLTCGTTAGNIYYTAANTGNYDVAEKYAVSDPSITAGDIVALDPSHSLYLMKASAGSRAIGIVSTAPGLTLGGADAAAQGSSSLPIALSGRVPVKVNLDNGPITIGDTIGLSDIPGIGEKAAPGDSTIGIALEQFTASSTGPIQVFVSLQQGNGIASSAAKLTLNVASTTAPSTASAVTDASSTPIVASTSTPSITSGSIGQYYSQPSSPSMSASDIAALASTTAMAAVQSAVPDAVSSSISSSTILDSIASSTADTLASSTPSFIVRIANAVISYIQSAANWVFEKITAHTIVSTDIQTQSIETQTASVANGLEMTDSITGQIYCVRITNGNFDKVVGACPAVASSTVPATPPIIQPTQSIQTPVSQPISVPQTSSSTPPTASSTESSSSQISTSTAPSVVTTSPAVSAPASSTPSSSVQTPTPTPASSSSSTSSAGSTPTTSAPSTTSVSNTSQTTTGSSAPSAPITSSDTSTPTSVSTTPSASSSSPAPSSSAPTPVAPDAPSSAPTSPVVAPSTSS